MWGDGGWWILIIIFALFGWGGNGFGGFGGGSTGASFTDAAIQRGFDNQSVMNKLNGIEQGLSSLGYDQLNQMNGINQNISQTGFAIQQAINADTVAGMQNTNAIQSTLCNMQAQQQACCCETQRQIERGFADTNYNMATQACETRQAIADSTRSILDFLTQDKIASLTAENQSLKFQASQTAQNSYLAAMSEAQTAELIRRLGADCPQPAYVVQPPQPVTFPTNCCGGVNTFNGGFGNGCDCNRCC